MTRSKQQLQPRDLLVLIWVHGFKGNDVTFEGFPERIVRILEEAHPNLNVVSHVFPAYQTRGELNAATDAFVAWLTGKVVTLENGDGAGRGAGSAKVVLMGHSMGGLLIADAVTQIEHSTREKDPLWPNVIATVAYDTPYLGLHPHVFKHQLSQAASYAETARSVAGNLAMLSPLALGWGFGKAKQAEDKAAADAEKDKRKERSPAADPAAQPAEERGGWWTAKTAMGIGALAMAGAAAAGAYYREDLSNTFATGWRWGFDHMTFVRNLWDSDGLKRRMERIEENRARRHVAFANFYTTLPPKPPHHPNERTFTILPPTSDPLRPFWRPQINSKAKDEISAHMGMFNASTNDGFYDLGLQVSRLITRRLLDSGAADLPRTPGRSPTPAERINEEGLAGEKGGVGDGVRRSPRLNKKQKSGMSQVEKEVIDLTGED